MCWRVGISGSYWYAAGASVQIMLFAILATQVKRRAPNMRTFMELVRVRWGTAAHITFVCFALTTNVIVSAMLILGGAATLNALTGMSTNAAAFLVPIVACLPYTLIGGLRATFLAHYFNTLFIFIALFIFMFTGYLSEYVGSGTDYYGSPDLVLSALEATSEHAVMTHVDWEPEKESPETDATKYGMEGFSAYIKNAGKCYKDKKETDTTCWYRARPDIDDFCHEKCKTNSLDVQACGNMKEGCITTSEKEHWEQKECKDDEYCVPSLATMDSHSGFVFGIVNIVGNFGTVFVDQSYWQSAIAVKPESAASGYILGGVVWFAVPMMMGTTHGLVGRALTTNFDLVNGASHITANDSGSGLTPARVAVEMLGETGAWVLLFMLFMAIVSTGCAEIIAVATIMTYDIYCEYLNWDLKTERMNNRQIFYATVLGENSDLGVSRARKPANPIKVEKIALKSTEKVDARAADGPLGSLLTKLEGASILPSAREFEPEERRAIQSVLVGYTGSDGLVTYENVYFAVQSQVLCKQSGEAGIVLRMMKFFCIGFAIFMGFLANFLQSLLAPYGRGLGFVYCSMGIFVGPAVAPAAMAILMESANAKWCTIGAISGLIFGIITWLATAQYIYEEITIKTLDNDYPFLWSNLMSICFSGLVAIAGSLADPNKEFKWEHLGVQLPLVDDMPPLVEASVGDKMEEFLLKSYNRSVKVAMFLFIFLCALLPGVLYLSNMIFSSTMFTVWVIIFMLWCFIGGLSVIILPIYDFKKDYDAAQVLKAQQAKI
jgi:Na+/proline symporter